MEFKYVLSQKGNEIQQEVRIDEILVIPEFQPRKALDFGLIETLKLAEYIPAIKLGYFPEKYGSKLVLIDGNHRFKSRVETEECIQANIYEYESDLDIFKDATRANLSHGKMLTKEEKKASIAKIIELIPREIFSASKLADELGGQDCREIRKISCWVDIKGIIGEKKATLLNISKADILYRLIKEGTLTNQEFEDFFDIYYTLNFNELNAVINQKIKGEPIKDPREMAVENFDSVLDEIDNLEKELDIKIDEQELKFIAEEMPLQTEITPEVLIQTIFGETRNAIKTLNQFKADGKFENNKELIRKEITSLKEEIAKLEKEVS